MDSAELVSCIESLDDDIDDLEEALEPLLSCPLTETANKLPLLDKAQLYVLATYAIESTLFSYLRLNGVNAKDHPVFRELTRVKQYFEKIKNAETAGENLTPATKLDKSAASRFIKHGLAGNDNHDQRAEQQLEERKRELQAKLASQKAKKRQDQVPAEQVRQRELAAKTKAHFMAQKRKLEASSNDDADESDSSSSSSAAIDSSITAQTNTHAKSEDPVSALSTHKRTKL